MRILRLTQSSLGRHKYRVEAAFEADGQPRQIAATDFELQLAPQDREDLRWYLEDYLQNPIEPAPRIAARIETRIVELGSALFRAIFHANDDVRDLWAILRPQLNDTRIEILTGVEEATALPWELMRDPKTDTPLALGAAAFVRASHCSAQTPRLPTAGKQQIRILLVICRPAGGEDVPFRSVASRLIKALGTARRESLQLDVLRPPTFRQLSKVLRAAKAAGRPYHVVHFDGHGAYEDINVQSDVAALRRALSNQMLSTPRNGVHGYLVFENHAVEENLQLVDGPALGKLLVETDVSVLVLNACRSAHAEAPPVPAEASPAGSPAPAAFADVHARARAFGSLAQEVVDAGVPGVVAMRYQVYVVTAAQFVADLYEALVAGQSLGAAVSLGRKQLESAALREIGDETRPLQDWMVPVVYEAAPVRLFGEPDKRQLLKITVRADAAAPAVAGIVPELERQPDVGFFGRDETLLALDRAFDRTSVVLLHGYAGSGKTSTAAEFARWYRLTGGVDGPVLFTSFERHKPLAQVLNESIGRVFGDALERAGAHWLALDDEQRRELALVVLDQVPVLWIWDNVEPIAGFPPGTVSAWSAEQQQDLFDFLYAAGQRKAKVLLTSRRDERQWLGDLPVRIAAAPMPMQERVQLARALAERQGRRLSTKHWLPLLRFTAGNPLTITLVVRQVLHDGLTSEAQLADFVRRLQAGQARFEDAPAVGRDKSLDASLSYGFDNAFDELELRQLALLHLFQGVVTVDVLCIMGFCESGACAPALRGFTQEAGCSLLDRAVDIGLLTSHGFARYGIHPALPWFFTDLFSRFYPTGDAELGPARQAFATAMATLGNRCRELADDGEARAVGLLSSEEANLLYARQIAVAEKDPWGIVYTTRALGALYKHTGRRTEWTHLYDELVPLFVDPDDLPLPGREAQWLLITECRIALAHDALQWDEAERLARLAVDWTKQEAASALAAPADKLDEDQRGCLRNLAASMNMLGLALRQQGNRECLAAFAENYEVLVRAGDRPAAWVSALQLGYSFLTIAAFRDVDEAERWTRRAVDLAGTDANRAQSLLQLATVVRNRAEDMIDAHGQTAASRADLDTAAKLALEGLALTPAGAVDALSIAHHQVGNVYGAAGELDRALEHWRESIRYEEEQDNPTGAAESRISVAMALGRAGRLTDALEYATAALRNLEPLGHLAPAHKLHQCRQLVSGLRAVLAARSEAGSRRAGPDAP